MQRVDRHCTISHGAMHSSKKVPTVTLINGELVDVIALFYYHVPTQFLPL